MRAPNCKIRFGFERLTAPVYNDMVTCPFLGFACVAIPMALPVRVRVFDLREAEDRYFNTIVGQNPMLIRGKSWRFSLEIGPS